ncbi:acyl-CoA carboxylase subunit epsilon [Subtercola endophyticus]|uniref:acyl-CoA carboxylase subunit epsilon n=1 Tax=Subtercola endophyticus TaxID=2895559 RepID=UPI001E2AEBE4|nr:acyl-CoA carboxylase subunit epsilon [Subtercola endophyticus]UFS57764.1 acyl-CoA carboxylase subunit epsilon [Subtercola endophyticus]
MSDAEAPADNTPVIVKTKNVTATEIAAVTAVVRGMLIEENDSLRVEQTPPPSRWQRSQRAMRGALNSATNSWVD